ncbi:MAG: helix-hairpin-helix domain-containing protein [Bacteroidetes bacterium]|jgi:putative hydrolase|nr:helix-hairpin-helix domain-containing protein [Bacteroidota bacterium]MDF1867638.1 helix-hairpin-helix domain-containing protein [Saprospiraceae bacterium]
MINSYHIPTNREIAKLMDEIADLLEIQHANEYRIRAYRNASKLIRERQDELSKIVLSGKEKTLHLIPGIGTSLERLISEYVKTGKSKLLNRLEGEVCPEKLFEEIPGIGKELAERIVRELDIHSLEELEQAAHNGKLAKVPGFGRKRVEAIRVSLAGLLSGFAHRRVIQVTSALDKEITIPSVALLLEIDSIYREKSFFGELKKIAPRRFNPRNLVWLPILHIEKEDWDFTALFSNTARAHQLNKTKDWVVIFYEKNGHEGQATVVTETRGVLTGSRVVRGRERACKELLLTA